MEYLKHGSGKGGTDFVGNIARKAELPTRGGGKFSKF
jgi:hypothetical protein